MVIFWNQRLSDESIIAILAFLKLVFTWHYFCPFSFNSSMSLYFRCFFYKKHIVGFCIFIQVRNFCLTRLIHLNFLWLYKFRVIFNARFLFFKYLFFPSLFPALFCSCYLFVLCSFYIILHRHRHAHTHTHTHTYWCPVLLCYYILFQSFFTTIKEQNLFLK